MPEELALATKNYAELVGKGGFGKVYRGVFCHQDVAVKQLDPVLMCMFVPMLASTMLWQSSHVVTFMWKLW